MEQIRTKIAFNVMLTKSQKYFNTVEVRAGLAINEVTIKDRVFIACVFDKVNFDKCHFDNVIFLKCSFDNAEFTESTFDNVRIVKSSLVGADLRNLDLTLVRFSNCDFEEANFSFSELSKDPCLSIMPFNNIDDCNFNNAVFDSVIARYANIENCDFTNADLLDSDFSSSTFIYYDLEAEKKFKVSIDYIECKNGRFDAVNPKTFSFVKKSKAKLSKANVKTINPYKAIDEHLKLRFND